MDIYDWMRKSHWWGKESRNLYEQGLWNVIHEDDGMGPPEGSLGLFEGTLGAVIQHALDTFGESFSGWGHQGRVERVLVTKVPAIFTGR